jgi:hypothetical protein
MGLGTPIYVKCATTILGSLDKVAGVIDFIEPLGMASLMSIFSLKRGWPNPTKSSKS